MAAGIVVDPVHAMLFEDSHLLLLSALVTIKASNPAPHAQPQPSLREPCLDHTFAPDGRLGLGESSSGSLWQALPVWRCQGGSPRAPPLLRYTREGSTARGRRMVSA